MLATPKRSNSASHEELKDPEFTKPTRTERSANERNGANNYFANGSHETMFDIGQITLAPLSHILYASSFVELFATS